MRFNLINLLLAAFFCLVATIGGVKAFGPHPVVWITSFIIGLLVSIFFSWLVASYLWKKDQQRHASASNPAPASDQRN